MEIRAIHLPDLAFDPSFGVNIFKYNFEKKSFVAINDPGKEYSLNYIMGNKDFLVFKSEIKTESWKLLSQATITKRGVIEIINHDDILDTIEKLDNGFKSSSTISKKAIF